VTERAATEVVEADTTELVSTVAQELIEREVDEAAEIIVIATVEPTTTLTCAVVLWTSMVDPETAVTVPVTGVKFAPPTGNEDLFEELPEPKGPFLCFPPPKPPNRAPNGRTHPVEDAGKTDIVLAANTPAEFSEPMAVAHSPTFRADRLTVVRTEKLVPLPKLTFTARPLVRLSEKEPRATLLITPAIAPERTGAFATLAVLAFVAMVVAEEALEVELPHAASTSAVPPTKRPTPTNRDNAPGLFVGWRLTISQKFTLTLLVLSPKVL
jgi:hypothetical protein